MSRFSGRELWKFPFDFVDNECQVIYQPSRALRLWGIFSHPPQLTIVQGPLQGAIWIEGNFRIFPYDFPMLPVYRASAFNRAIADSF
jgi:hypothetical protein